MESRCHVGFGGRWYGWRGRAALLAEELADTPEWLRPRRGVVRMPAGAWGSADLAGMEPGRRATVLALPPDPEGVTLVADGWPEEGAQRLTGLLLELLRAMPEWVRAGARALLRYSPRSVVTVVADELWTQLQTRVVAPLNLATSHRGGHEGGPGRARWAPRHWPDGGRYGRAVPVHTLRRVEQLMRRTPEWQEREVGAEPSAGLARTRATLAAGRGLRPAVDKSGLRTLAHCSPLGSAFLGMFPNALDERLEPLLEHAE